MEQGELSIYLNSDMGLVRSRNEDFAGAGNVTVRDGAESLSMEIPTSPFLFGVADGVGGGNAGDLASKAVFNYLAESLSKLEPGLSDAALREKAKSLGQEAHEELTRQGMLHSSRAGMATTATLVLLYEQRPYLLHAGDSRLYRLRGGALGQLSRDHTLREFSGNPNIPGNILVNCFGVERDFFLDFQSLGDEFESEVLYMCCSDGLSDSLAEEELRNILSSGDELASRGEELVSRAREASGHDNITVVLAERS